MDSQRAAREAYSRDAIKIELTYLVARQIKLIDRQAVYCAAGDAC